MNEVFEFLKEAHVFYLATSENGKPHVRPFGALAEFEGKMYTQTGKIKDVYKQMKANPKVELCSMGKDGWLRVEAEAIEDDRREARTAVLDQCPSLRNMYSEDDGNCTVFYFQNVTATFMKLNKAIKTVKF